MNLGNDYVEWRKRNHENLKNLFAVEHNEEFTKYCQEIYQKSKGEDLGGIKCQK